MSVTFPDATQLKKASRATRFVFFICGLAISSWAPMIPYIKERLNLNDADLGMLLFEFGVGALFIMPIAGWLVHKYGSRKIILSSAAFVIVLLPFLAAASSSVILGVLLFLFGLSMGASNIANNAHSLVVEAYLKCPAMSGFHCLFSLGGLAGASAMSLLLEIGLELSTCAIVVSAVMGILLLFQSRNLLPPEFRIAASQSSPLSFPGPKVLLIGALCFISFLAEGAMLDWSAVFLNSSAHYNEAIAGIGYAVFSVAMAFGRWTGNQLTQKIGRIQMIRFGSLVASGGLLLAIHTPWNYAELFGFFLMGIGVANTVPLMFSAAGRVQGTSPNVSLTIVTTFGYTGILLGPSLIGIVADMTSLSFALSCIAAMLILVGISVGSVQIKESAYPKAT